MTRRTNTARESRFSLVFFEIDDTYSIVETRKLEASVSGAETIRGAKVRVKSGKELFEAEIIEQSSSKTDLDAYLVDIEAASNNSITDQPQPKEQLLEASHPRTPRSQPSVDENVRGKDNSKNKTRKRKRNANAKEDKTEKNKKERVSLLGLLYKNKFSKLLYAI